MLITCPECQRQVSDTAASCPSCGWIPATRTSQQAAQVPKCPSCGSSDCEKISVRNKMGTAALFGLFAVGHLNKTYRCKNCGTKW